MPAFLFIKTICHGIILTSHGLALKFSRSLSNSIFMNKLKSQIKGIIAYHRTREDVPVTFKYVKLLVCKSPMMYVSLAFLITCMDELPNDLCILYDVSEKEDRFIVDLGQDLLFQIGIFSF